MAGFKGKQLRDTYKSILNLGESNNEVTGSIQTVKDGSGNNTALGVSNNSVRISTAFGTFTTPASAGSPGQILVSDGPGNRLYWSSSTATIDFQNFDQDLIPDQDQLRSLGTSARQWKDVFVGPGSLYVNAKRVISDDSGTIVVSTDDDQNLSVKTTGTGNLELAAEGTGALTFKSDINVQNGFAFYSTSSEIDFGDDINMNNRTVKGLAAPINDTDAVRKIDLETLDVESTLGYVPLDSDGDQMSGDLDMQSNKIVSLGDPTADQDAATKYYVDSVAAGLNWKKNVRVVQTQTAEMSGYTYNDAQEPSGNVWSGVTVNPVIDGITLAHGDRLLISNASDSRGHGIFRYDSANAGFYRTSDADNTPNNEIRGGEATFVSEGNTYSDTGWVLSTPTGNVSLGTDTMEWTQFSGTTLITAGTGLNKVGNELSIDSSVVTFASADQLYLGIDDRAADSELLDGIDSNGFLQTAGGDQSINGTLEVGAATNGTHALNWNSADLRYARLSAENTFTENQIIHKTGGGDAELSIRSRRDGTTYNNASLTFATPRSDTADGPGSPDNRGYITLVGEDSDIQSNLFLGANTANGTVSGTVSALRDNQSVLEISSDSSETVRYWRNGEVQARIDPAGTSLASEQSVVTKEKGDNRYAQVPAGQPGEMLYYVANKSFESDTAVYVGDFVDNATDLSAAQLGTVDQSQLFDSWYRFVHLSGGPVYPMSNNPAELQGEQTAWTYNSTEDRVENTTNSNGVIGLVSLEKSDSYTIDAQIGSTSTDDDMIGICIAFVTEGTPGEPDYNEHHLAVFRNNNSSRYHYYVVYNQADFNTLRSENGAGIRIDLTSLLPLNTAYTTGGGNDGVGNGWNEAGVGCPLKVERDGDQITVWSNDMGTTAIDNATQYTFSLTDYPELEKFRGKTRYGFVSQSQPNSFWDATVAATKIYALHEDNTYEFDGTNWNATGESIESSVGLGRILANPKTNKIYYSRGPNDYQIISDQLNATGLYFGPDLKAEAVSTGVDVTGELQADSATVYDELNIGALGSGNDATNGLVLHQRDTGFSESITFPDDSNNRRGLFGVDSNDNFIFRVAQGTIDTYIFKPDEIDGPNNFKIGNGKGEEIEFNQSNQHTYIRRGGSDAITIGTRVALDRGLEFGSASVSDPLDLSRHLALYANAYGFSITSNTLNVKSGDHTDFYNDNALSLRVGNTEVRCYNQLHANPINMGSFSTTNWDGIFYNDANTWGGTGAFFFLADQDDPNTTTPDENSATAAILAQRLWVRDTGTGILPVSDNTTNIGTGSRRFDNIYATNGTIITSDARMKQEVQDIPLGLDFINNLRPVSYKYNDKENDLTRFGFIAQEVKEALPEEPVNMWRESVLESGETRQELVYQEVIAPLVKAVQELSQENKDLRARIEALESKNQ